MSDTLEALRGKISGADDLQSVVRSMKSLAASCIGQYEKSVVALGDYSRTVEMGLSVCLRQSGLAGGTNSKSQADAGSIRAVVFGSDQGLVGQFNDVLTAYVVRILAALPGKKRVWAVGERIHDRLADAGLEPVGLFTVPTSVGGITPLVSQMMEIEIKAQHGKAVFAPLYLFHNGPTSGTLYEPQSLRLLPLDRAWQQGLTSLQWPTGNLPEVIGNSENTFLALINEYLFVSIFRASAESLASENASRLAAMQRAEKNINDLLGGFHRSFNRQRQSSIDEEMFDVISGFEAQTEPARARGIERPGDTEV